MQVNIGEKIRELRKRDGRKQEDLAIALGVTCQAVSRWEANGGYPDMNMIPAIANYFHVSIDSLFGYNNDRDRRIREYTDESQRMINTEHDMTECIELLRKGLEEFPEEHGLMKLLALALSKKGFDHKDDDFNPYLEEAAALYEKLLPEDEACIIPLLSIYSQLGEAEKAVKKASEQTPLELSREILLGQILGSKEHIKYSEESVLYLLHVLRQAIEETISVNDKLLCSKDTLDILVLERKLISKILGKECFGYHSDLFFIDLCCVRVAGKIKDYDSALKYFDSAHSEYKKFKEWGNATFLKWEETHEPQTNTYFESDFLSEVDASRGKVVLCEPQYMENAISSLPKKIKTKIVENPNYKDIFGS